MDINVIKTPPKNSNLTTIAAEKAAAASEGNLKSPLKNFLQLNSFFN